MQTVLLDLTGAVDWDLIATPAGAGGGSQVVAISGYEWWLVVAVQASLDNSLAAAQAAVVVQLLQQGSQLIAACSAISTSAGSSNVYSFGLGLGANALPDGTQPSAPLPWLPVVGPGSVQVAPNGGDATTKLNAGSVTILGRRYRNVRR